MAIKKKPGGGNHPQNYDTNTGEYSNVSLSFEEELMNIKNRYEKRDINTYYPRFPIYGYHNDEYAKLFAEHALYGYSFNLAIEKVNQYLLVHKDKNDKSQFFNIHGYSLDNWYELYEQIIKGSKDKELYFNRFNETGLFVYTKTNIKSKFLNNDIKICCSWRVEVIGGNYSLRFITVIPSKELI